MFKFENRNIKRFQAKLIRRAGQQHSRLPLALCCQTCHILTISNAAGACLTEHYYSGSRHCLENILRKDITSTKKDHLLMYLPIIFFLKLFSDDTF